MRSKATRRVRGRVVHPKLLIPVLPTLCRIPTSVSVYSVSPMCFARALPRSKGDGIVPHTHHVHSRMV